MLQEAADDAHATHCDPDMTNPSLQTTEQLEVYLLFRISGAEQVTHLVSAVALQGETSAWPAVHREHVWQLLS